MLNDKKQYVVHLASCGNPDMGQDPGQPVWGCEPDKSVAVASIEDAVKACRDFIEDNGLGGSQWSGGKVWLKEGDSLKVVARISYNGRVIWLDEVANLKEIQRETAENDAVFREKAKEYRLQALSLLKEAQAIDGVRPFLVTHLHAVGNGADSYVVWSNLYPGDEEASAVLPSGLKFDEGEALIIDDEITLEDVTGNDIEYRLDKVGVDFRTAVQSVIEQCGGDVWGECSEYPLSDWQYQTNNGCTVRGYWEWVACEAEANGVAIETLSGSPKHTMK